MPQARLSISVPEDVWVHDVSTTHPDCSFRVLTALTTEADGIALIELQASDPVSVIAEINQHDDIRALELLWKGETETLIQLTTTRPSLLVPVMQAGVPIEMPFTVQNGRVTWTVTTSSPRFSEFGTRLEEAGIEYRLEYVHEVGANEVDHLLTNRQREVLMTALAAGYYATPRQTTLTEVADRLEISKATCSDILHRAEGSVLSWFADEYLTGNRLP